MRIAVILYILNLFALCSISSATDDTASHHFLTMNMLSEKAADNDFSEKSFLRNIVTLLINMGAPYGVDVDSSGNMFVGSSAGLFRVKWDGFTADVAMLNTPCKSAAITDVVIDSRNRIFYACFCQVYMMTPDGSSSVYAGSGPCSFGGDGGQASYYNLNYPWGLAIDKNDNLYIADTYNHRIRKVESPSTIITTVAGTGNFDYDGKEYVPATTVNLYYPYGVAVDDDNNIYIADTYNLRIRKVSASNGYMTTLAGTGRGGYDRDNVPATVATLWYPYGVDVDEYGNIYIADSNNNRIRMIAASTGIITTIAGTGSGGFSGDNGPATSANLNNPYKISVRMYGNVLVADSGNNRIRFITACSPGQGINTTTSTCQNCPPGSYSVASARCMPCGVGTYSDTGGSITCKTCPPGSYASSVGQSQCSLCQAGSYSDQSGQSECIKCPLGSYNPNKGRNDGCIKCPMGTYANITGLSACQLCPSGTYNLNTGSTSSALCVVCPAGTASLSGSSVCCPVGTYLKQGVSPTCEFCPEGFIADPRGSTTCTPCPAGSSAKPFSTQCTPCPENTYAPVPGSACLQCSSGTYSYAGASLCEKSGSIAPPSISSPSISPTNVSTFAPTTNASSVAASPSTPRTPSTNTGTSSTVGQAVLLALERSLMFAFDVAAVVGVLFLAVVSTRAYMNSVERRRMGMEPLHMSESVTNNNSTTHIAHDQQGNNNATSVVESAKGEEEDDVEVVQWTAVSTIPIAEDEEGDDENEGDGKSLIMKDNNKHVVLTSNDDNENV